MKNVKNTLTIFNKIVVAQQLLDSCSARRRDYLDRAQEALDEALALIENLSKELEGGAA